MQKQLTGLITVMLLGLFVFSLNSEAVTFRMEEVPETSETGIPHEKSAEFDIRFKIDAVEASEGEDPLNLGGISVIALYVDYDENVIEPVNPDAPFTIGDYIPVGAIPFKNGIVDAGGEIGNALTLNLAKFGEPYGERVDDGLIATVTFKMLIDPPNTTCMTFLENGDNRTIFRTDVTGVIDLIPTMLHKCDISLPVQLSLFTATFDDRGVNIGWRTESEINNLGFDVYRSESPDGEFVKVNPAYIKGAGTDVTPHDYQFVDESTVAGKTYYYYIEAISFSGERERSHIIKVNIDISGRFQVTDLMQPTTFALLQNFPNPFNPETWIPFHLANDADVNIRIFDIRGQELRTIHLGQMPAGYYDSKDKAFLWDGRDSYGQEISSGIYFYNLTAGKFHATRKLIVIK